MRTSIQLINPGATMKHAKKHSRRARRHNPSGKAALGAAGHTLAKVAVGAVATYIGKKALGMKDAAGVPRLSPKQQLLAQGVVAAAAAAGGALLDNPMLRDAADGTAIVMGGDAAMAALYQYRVEEQVRAAVGAPAATPALPAPGATQPGGYLYGAAPTYAQPRGN